ncbi:hypothetical protein JCM11602_03410 [Thermus brockianus]
MVEVLITEKTYPVRPARPFSRSHTVPTVETETQGAQDREQDCEPVEGQGKQQKEG